MSTRPDLALNIGTKGGKPEIYAEVCSQLPRFPVTQLTIFECKKRGHSKRPEELTAQEIAHLIGTTVAFKEDFQEQERYTVSDPLTTNPNYL